MILPANILQPLIDVANAVLQFFHDNAGLSWGMSIIALTIVTRALLIPLTYKQLKGMRALQALQPQIKEIQSKYKNDKQRMQQEMMAFYKENKVNPFASCMPLLAQLPVFITLFYVLRHELPADIGCKAGHCGSEASFLFINDLTAKAHGGELIALLILYVGTQLVSGHGDVGHRRQKPADDDVRAPVHLRPLRDQLPRRPRPLLDHDQLLDDRPAVRDPADHPGAPRGHARGGGRAETATSAA